MHMQLLNNDRTDFVFSNLTLPNGTCRHDPSDKVLNITDCTAHSLEYDIACNTFRPLFVQTGGYNDGEGKIRSFGPCETRDWQETNNALVVKRWYSTNHYISD